MQQTVDIAPLPTLDDPAPQMVEQLPDVLRFFRALSPDPEQVVKVPKILPEDVSCERQFASRSWRNSWWKCRRSFLGPCCSSLWSKTPTFQFLVVEGESLVIKVFFPDRVQQRCMFLQNAFLSGLWSRTLISPLVEASKIFAHYRVHPLLRTFQLVFLKLWMSLLKGFFALFPKSKKSAKLGSHSGSELLAESSPSTPAAHVDSWVDGEDVWIRIDFVQGPYCRKLLSDHWQWYRRGKGSDGSTVAMGLWMRLSLVAERQEWSWLERSILVHPLAQWLEQPLVQTVPRAACQSWRLLKEFSSSTLLCRRAVRTRKSGLCLRSRIFQSFWCMGVSCRVRRIGFGTRALLGLTVGTCSTGCFGRISHIFYVAVNSNPEAVFLHSV